MRALNIAWKDFRHVYRDIAGLAMMFVAPLLLAGALGAAFGSGDNYSVAAVKTVVVEEDAGAGAGMPAAGAALTAALTAPEMAVLLDVSMAETPDAARSAVDAGDAAAAVIIPPGLSAALLGTGSLGTGAASPGTPGAALPGPDSPAAEVEIYKDPALNVGPSIVAAVVNSVTQSLNGARAAALAAAQLALSSGVSDSAAIADLASKAAQTVVQQGQSEALVTLRQRNPVVEGVDTEKRPNVASQVLVGMMLFFMLFGAATPARSILDEHREGTLPRLFTTPTPRSVILGGKYISVFVVVLIQAAILLVAGRFLLGADWGEPGPVAVLTLASALVAASLGLVTVSFAKTPGQAGAISSVVFVFIGLVSGNFTGTASTGGAFALARRISPVGWLMEGWKNVLFGGSWESIAVQAAVALGFALVFFGIATFFFRRRYA